MTIAPGFQPTDQAFANWSQATVLNDQGKVVAAPEPPGQDVDYWVEWVRENLKIVPTGCKLQVPLHDRAVTGPLLLAKLTDSERSRVCF